MKRWAIFEILLVVSKIMDLRLLQLTTRWQGIIFSELNFDVTSPQKISLFGKYESEFVALEVKQTLRQDGTRKQLQ